MDLLAGLMTGSLQASTTPGPADDYWYHPVGTMTSAGIRIDESGAQKISAWYRGRDILATSLAMLPLVVYRRLPNEHGREADPRHPLYDVLHRKPNLWQDAFQYRRQAMFHIIDHGNAYARLIPGARGFVDQLWPVHPTLVTPDQVESGRILYHARHPKTNAMTTYTQDEIFHLRGASLDGITGKGILEYARDSLALGIVLENYASKLFSRGAMTGGYIQIPTGPVDEGAMKVMANSYKTAIGDWHMPKVLLHGATWKEATMEPEKAQMILSRKFSVNDIARWLGLPPHMLADLDRSTNNNIEHQGQEFVTYSLGEWLSLWEFGINDQLLVRPDTYYAEFVRDALVRGDIATRWTAHVAGVNAGIVAPNEARVKENLPKMPGLDTPREPANITGSRRATDTPPPKKAPVAAQDEDDATGQARSIAVASAARVLRKEIAAVQRMAVRHAADGDAFAAAVTGWYVKHVALVRDALHVSTADAEGYCAGQASQVISGDWITALDQWGTDHYARGVAGLALQEVA